MIDPSASEETPAARRRLAWVTTAAFVALTLPRLLLHELWRDEAWQWLVIFQSRSLDELFSGLARGSGQGYLFPVFCFLLRLLWESPRSMQLANLVVAAGAAFAFTRWAPLRRHERVLFVLGYFPFYEYAILSRSYGTGVLLLLLACAAWGLRRPALAFGAAIGLLCQTTVYGYILAIALACGWLVHRWRHRRELARLRGTEAAAGLALALAGAIAGVVQFVPVPGTQVFPWRFHWDPAYALRVSIMPWRAFVPAPRPELTFWNTNLLDPWPVAQAVAGALVLVLAAALLWRSRVALATFGVGVSGLLAFGYLFFHGVVRHQGHVWILFVAALWLGGGSSLLGDVRAWRSRAFLALLIVHCGVAAFASWMDLRHPFSNGRATAELIRSTGLDRHPLLGHREPPAATVALYLGRPLYSPSREIYVTHPDWGPRQRELADPELRCAARELARREGRDVVLVMNRELPRWEELRPAGSRRGAIVATEDYHLYRLLRGRLSSTGAAAGCPEELVAGR